MSADARLCYVCTGCGWIHYKNPRVIVCCVVSWQDKVLFCRRAEEPTKGQWTIPAGFLECGETLEEGAAREAGEETGVSVDPAQLKLCSILSIPSIDQIVLSFECAG